MSGFLNSLERILMPLMNKISNQRHLNSIRGGLIATIPLSIIGAVFLLIPTFPWPQVYVDFMGANGKLVSVLLVPFHMTLGLLSVYVSFGIGAKLAQYYNLDYLAGGVSAALTFLSTVGFSFLEEGTFLNASYLGGEGMFTAIVTSLLAIEIMHFCDKKNIGIKLPDSVPANIGRSFDSLFPIMISVVFVTVIVHGFGFDINHIISSIITPLLSASSNSIISPILYVSLSAVMWFFGIHPAILLAIMSPVWSANAATNMEAVANGLSIPNVGVEPFIFTFVMIGGGGATLALCVMMCFSKSKALKSLGRLSIVTSVCNINEPIIFGLPIVLNPILIIPFFMGPVICCITTYIAFTTGLVPGMGYPFAAVWNLPSIFAGVLCTVSWRGAALVVVNFIIMAVVYYPFFKIYEKKCLSDETGST